MTLRTGSWLLATCIVMAAAGPAIKVVSSPPGSTSHEAIISAGSARQFHLSGTASCSARACHGGLEFDESPPSKRSYSTWLLHDKHRSAARVLESERSREIARRLQIKEPEAEERCLVCHSNPQLAVSARDDSRKVERAYGVGCEACHGAASNWLEEHSKPAWKQKSLAEKRAAGMWVSPSSPRQDLVEAARVCAGCHVGAPPKAPGGVAGEVTHELIAAGHPRLTFEFGAYLAWMPKHWAEAKDSTFEPRAWAVGQLASAETILDLLAHRAETTPQAWPEFAEYDCFACHHDLHAAPRPAEHRDNASEPLAGSLPWGTWQLAMVRHALAAQPGHEDALILSGLDGLRAFLGEPRILTEATRQRARAAAAKLRSAAQRLDRNGNFEDASMRGLAKTIANQGAARPEASWDEKAQRCLALVALELGSGQRRPGAGPPRSEASRALERILRFPPGYDSPRDAMDPSRLDGEVRELFQQLGR